MREFAYGFTGILLAAGIILVIVDRLLRKPPKRYYNR